MQTLGIDVSKWQGKFFDFEKAKKEHNLDFVIIKAGGGDDGLYCDSRFEENYEKAKKAGLKVGAYFYGNATDISSAENEGRYFLSLLKGKQFEMPVYYDIEGAMLSVSNLSDLAVAFCEVLENAGYYVGIYASHSVFENQLNTDDITAYTWWVASWKKTKPTVKGVMGLWQFGGSTNLIRDSLINGIVVDQNYCYQDFETAIKANGLNGFIKQSKKSNEEIALEVIRGDWGNGQERKNKISTAGYNYSAIQSLVNKYKKEGKF